MDRYQAKESWKICNVQWHSSAKEAMACLLNLSLAGADSSVFMNYICEQLSI